MHPLSPASLVSSAASAVAAVAAQQQQFPQGCLELSVVLARTQTVCHPHAWHSGPTLGLAEPHRGAAAAADTAAAVAGIAVAGAVQKWQRRLCEQLLFRWPET